MTRQNVVWGEGVSFSFVIKTNPEEVNDPVFRLIDLIILDNDPLIRLINRVFRKFEPVFQVINLMFRIINSNTSNHSAHTSKQSYFFLNNTSRT